MDSRRTVRHCTLAAAALAALVTPGDARAEPPPPSFWRFTVTNTTGFDMRAIELKLYMSRPPLREQIDMQNPIVVHIPSLGNGQSFSYDPSQTTWGVALVQCTEARVMAGTPNGLRLAEALQITAKRAAFVSGMQPKFAGFTNDGPTSSFPMAMAFGANDAHLRAKWRWGWNWPDGVLDAPPGNPDGNEIENWANGPEEVKTTYTPAENPLPEWATTDPCACPH
jgi:hypothetical protein